MSGTVKVTRGQRKEALNAMIHRESKPGMTPNESRLEALIRLGWTPPPRT